MARPKKNNADYFSHDATMRSDPKVTYIRNKHGIMGYGIYCMMLEELTNSDNFEIKRSDMQCLLLSGDFGVSEQELQDCIDDMVKVQLLQLHEEILFSQGLKKRLQAVVDKRNRGRQNRSGVPAAGTPEKDSSCDRNSTTDGVSVTEMQEKKVKETKGNETIEKETKEIKENTSNKESTTPPGKRSIINKHNKKGAVAIYDTIKDLNDGIIDGTLNDCAYLLAKIKRIESLDREPHEYLSLLIQAMRQSDVSKYFSTSSPSKINDKLADIINRVKDQLHTSSLNPTYI